MLRKVIIAAAAFAMLACAAVPSQAQPVKVVATCGTVSPAFATSLTSGLITMDVNGLLCTAASVSASISGFPTVQSTGTPISVTTSSVTGTLPTGAVVVASNVGATNGAYCKLGATATTSDQLIPPNSWFAFTVGANTQLSCITSTSTTTVNMVGGSGLPTGSGGGGGGGGGGAVTVADGADVTQGAKADAACGTATGTCSEIALFKFLNTAATAATPAGENHIGEIASNQIKVQVAQTVTASAYAAGNALGGLMTIANAARVSGSAGAAGTGGILTGLQLNSKTIQTGVQVDVFIFDANPTGSTCTDKTAFVIAAADFDKVVGILTIPSTAANGAGWFGATTTGAVGIPTYYPVTYDLASSTSIYACAVVRAAITPAATTDISFKYNMLRN